MAKHMETGKKGETFAAGWLSANGYTLLHRNWRFRKCEIDIVAVKNGKLHLIEVKTSTNLRFGFPEERIRKKKAMQMMRSEKALKPVVSISGIPATVCQNQTITPASSATSKDTTAATKTQYPKPTQQDINYVRAHPEKADWYRAHFGLNPPSMTDLIPR